MPGNWGDPSPLTGALPNPRLVRIAFSEKERAEYEQSIQQQAIRLVLDGNSQREAARHVGVSHSTLANWFREYADTFAWSRRQLHNRDYPFDEKHVIDFV